MKNSPNKIPVWPVYAADVLMFAAVFAVALPNMYTGEPLSATSVFFCCLMVLGGLLLCLAPYYAGLKGAEREEKAAAEGGKAPSYKPLLIYRDPNEAVMAYSQGEVGLHAPILVRVTKSFDGVEKSKVIESTVGRIIFNEKIPQDLGYVDRSDPEHAFDHEIGFQVGKKQLGDIIDRCIKIHDFTISAEVLDGIKAMGYKYSTVGAITISIADMTVPEAKKTLISETENKVLAIERQFKRGFITDDERYRLVVSEWEQTTKDVTSALQNCLDTYNPIYMMANSGARGSMNQIRQLAGMRGLMANTSGKTIEIPIKANFREGLSVLEYFTSSRGARKGLADTALRTADSGYLTRRMVDVCQDVIIREADCAPGRVFWCPRSARAVRSSRSSPSASRAASRSAISSSPAPTRYSSPRIT